MKKTNKTYAIALALLSTAALVSCGETPATSSSQTVSSQATSSQTVSSQATSSQTVSSQATSSQADASSQEEGSSIVSSTPIEGEASVDWWVPYGETSALMTYAKGVADAFHAANPNITVNITSKGSYNNDYVGCASAVSDALQGGNTPDMVTTYGTYVAAWRKAASAAVADVSEHGKALEGDADFNQEYLKVERDQYAGSYYSLPYSKSGEVVQYNLDAFNAVGDAIPGREAEANASLSAPAYPAPKAKTTKQAYNVPNTFNGWMEVAKQMKIDYDGVINWGRYTSGDNQGYYEAVPVIYEDETNLFLGALESAGIQAIDLTKSVGASPVFLNSSAAKDIAIQLKKWSNEGLLATAGQLPMRNSYSHQYPSTYVGAAQAMVMITSTANGPYDAVDGFAMGFTKNPKWNANSAFKTVSQGPSIAFFNHTDANRLKAALAFYDYLTNGVNSVALTKQTYYFPTRTSSLQDETIAAAVEAAKTEAKCTDEIATKKANYLGQIIKNNNEVTENGEYFMSPVNELSSKIRSAIKGMIDNLFNDTTKTSDEDVKAMVDAEWETMRDSILA